MEYERPVGAYPLHDLFYKICTICTPFKDVLAVKVSLDLPKGLWSYGGFNLTGVVTLKFSVSPSGITYASEGDRINQSRRILTRKRALWVS